MKGYVRFAPELFLWVIQTLLNKGNRGTGWEEGLSPFPSFPVKKAETMKTTDPISFTLLLSLVKYSNKTRWRKRSSWTGSQSFTLSLSFIPRLRSFTWRTRSHPLPSALNWLVLHPSPIYELTTKNKKMKEKLIHLRLYYLTRNKEGRQDKDSFPYFLNSFSLFLNLSLAVKLLNSFLLMRNQSPVGKAASLMNRNKTKPWESIQSGTWTCITGWNSSPYSMPGQAPFPFLSLLLLLIDLIRLPWATEP